MKSDVTAQHYAEALFGIGKSTGKLAVFQSNAEDFLKLLQGSRDLMTSLSHPNIQRGQRRAILDAVLSKCAYDKVFGNFLRLVVERGRAMYFPRMVSLFVGLRDLDDGRVRGTVFSASPLSLVQKNKLKAKIQSVLGHEVARTEVVDSSLIGGLRVEINGRVYDNTVCRQLEKLRESIVAGVHQ